MVLRSGVGLPRMPQKVQFFKEELSTELLYIPQSKPDINKILEITYWPQVLSTKLIETYQGKSFEGQYLTGYKLVVELSIKEKVVYSGDEPTQSIQAVHYETFKSMVVVLPSTWEGKKIEDMIRAERLTVTPYAEGDITKALTKRMIYRGMMILIDVRFC